ncbi:MAG: hypothetical protein LBI87_05085 [Candidatus Accumulibacter sp.]|nr:hypothetical protein [Accumulibacter sp.]
MTSSPKGRQFKGCGASRRKVRSWISAFAGMTGLSLFFAVVVMAVVVDDFRFSPRASWLPLFAPVLAAVQRWPVSKPLQ